MVCFNGAPNLAAILFLSIIVAFGGVATELSYLGKNAPKYDPKVVVCLAEAMKLVICYIIVGYQRPKGQSCMAAFILDVWGIPFCRLLLYAVPAFIYSLMNNMVFLFLGLETPAELQLLWNFKIVATTFLLSCFLKRRFASRQWLAVFVLCFGVVFSEMGHILKPRKQASVKSVQSSEPLLGEFLGPIVTLAGTVIMAFANVFCEYLYKLDENDGRDSLWMKNIRLYTFGVVANVFAYLVDYMNHPVSHGNSPFYGFNPWTWGIFVNSTFSGLLISAILKYLDNIALIHADAIGTILTTIFSALLFRLKIDGWFVAGALLILGGVYMYKIEMEILDTCLDPLCRDNRGHPEGDGGGVAQKGPMSINDTQGSNRGEQVLWRDIGTHADISDGGDDDSTEETPLI